MTDNKLKDNEIIKALECCSEANNCPQCEYEPTEHQIGTVGCCNELMKDALNLINRLQAENEKLNTFAEIKKEEIVKIIARAKTEAYKEFADKSKNEIESIKLHEPRNCWSHDTLNAFESKINIILHNLLKELVGDK